MRSLRLLPYMAYIQEHGGVAVSATLHCTCGDELFEISHTGRQTKGILAPLLLPRNGQLCVMARCLTCGETVCVYDSRTDGPAPRATDCPPAVPLSMKRGNDFRITVRLNYLPEYVRTDAGAYSNHFEALFADIQQPKCDGKTYTLREI